MNLKKVCQGAVVVTALSAQASVSAEPRDPQDLKVTRDALPRIEDVRVQPSLVLSGLKLPESVKDLVDLLSHSGNQPIC